MVLRGSGFLTRNAFLVAAAALPLLVAAFFIASTLVPRLLVPPPSYDLLLQAGDAYDARSANFSVDYEVRDGAVVATVRRIEAPTYLRPPALFLFDHETLTARELPIDLPGELPEGESVRTIAVAGLEGRRILAQTEAPDGYRVDTRSRRSPGIVGEIFGMNRYEPANAIVKDGRVVPIALPAQRQYYTIRSIGWVVPDGQQ
jgi:hypothetical protein